MKSFRIIEISFGIHKLHTVRGKSGREVLAKHMLEEHEIDVERRYRSGVNKGELYYHIGTWPQVKDSWGFNHFIKGGRNIKDNDLHVIVLPVKS